MVKERVELYLYSPYRPYGLYRASVPVQGCTLPYFYQNCSAVRVRLSDEQATVIRQTSAQVTNDVCQIK